MTKFLVLILAIFLTGCTLLQQTNEPMVPVISWKERINKLDHIQSWTAKGSISIQHEDQTNLASLQWQQQHQNYHFALFGPLGFGKVIIEGSPTSVTLIQSNQAPVSAATPELLMKQQLGWYMPVSHLYYWGRGLPAPGVRSVKTFDNNHRLSKLQQAGWKIEYLEYMPAGNIDLPKKMQLTSEKLKIKWVVKDWELIR